MLEIGSFQARLCSGIDRRAFLRAGLLAPFAWGLPGLSESSAAAEAKKAKSVLVLWLWGAPSHVDTFDPKPNAPAEFRGPFSTIPTRTPGVRFSELLPQLAARSNRFTLIRSNKNFNNTHTPAGTIALTGAVDGPGGLAPNYGAIIARQRGVDDLPSFLAIGRGHPRDVDGTLRGYGGGNWGRIYDPFLVRCSERGEIDIPDLKLINGLTPQHLNDRRLLLRELDNLRRSLDSTEIQKWNNTCQRAYSLLTSPRARQALDLSREAEKTRAAYGQTSFGQSCLLARRLVEAGVPYIQVNWSQYVEAMTPHCDFGWDTHIYNFELLADRHCPILDRVFSALLDDLHERGLLETTLVLCMGEFGRTPRITAEAARDHWAECYFSIWAGGGVQPGRVIGESDRAGQYPITEPITPPMMGTTILELAGITSQVRAELHVLPGGRVIHELL